MDILQDVKMSNVLPTYASIEECGMYAIEAAETDYTNMMMSIGINELGVLESTGATILYEASVKEIVDKVVQWLKDRWANIKEAFQKALTFLQNKVKEFAGKIKEFGLDKVTKKAGSIKEFEKDGKTVKVYGKTYTYPHLDTIVDGTDGIWGALDEYMDAAKTAAFYYYQNGKEDVSTAETINAIKDQMEEAKEKFFKKANFQKDVHSWIAANVKSYICGDDEIDVDKKYIVANIKDIYDGALDFGKTASKVKKQFNKIKGFYDSAIKAVSKEEKKVDPTVFGAYLPYLKFGSNVTTTIAGATLSCIKEKLSTDMKVLLKLAVAIKAKEAKEEKAAEAVKDGVKTESTVYESTSFQTELASLFNF